MSGPSRKPAPVRPATAAGSSTTPAPAPVSFWRQRVPSRIGRARTSTVVLGVLFVVLAGLYVLVRPDVEYTTITTETGESYRVPVDQIVPATESAEPAAPTTDAPEETGPSAVPTTTDPAETTTSRGTAPTTTEEETEPTGTTRATTSEAPATTEESAPDPDAGETATPTG